MSRSKKVLYIICGLVVVLLILMAWRSIEMRQNASPGVGMSLGSDFGLTVQYDMTQAAPQNQQAASAGAGTLWELVPIASPGSYKITADYEQGATIQKLTAATNKPIRDAIVDSIRRQLPKAYPSFVQEKALSRTINGHEAYDLIFTYEVNNRTIKARLLLLIKNDDSAVYLRAQALEATFETYNKDVFEPVFMSARFE